MFTTKVMEDLKRRIKEQDELLQSLKNQIQKLTKKSLKNYISMPHDRLILKCLELVTDVTSLEALSKKILRNENYDEETVNSKEEELRRRIQGHLNSDMAPAWNGAFLRKLTKKHDQKKAEKAVLELLKFRNT